MTVTRSFTNAFEVVEHTEVLKLIPNTWTLTEELGLFQKEFISQDVLTFEENKQTLGLITDVVRGTRALVNKDDTRRVHAYTVPSFVLDDYVSPSDLAGKSRFGNLDQAEQEADVVARKLARIMRSWAITKETARMHTITTGTAFAPNGTVVYDFYADAGVTRKNVDFVLSTATTDVIEICDQVISHIRDNLFAGDAALGGFVGLASPQFMTKLLKQASVKEAYKYFQRNQDPLASRVGGVQYRTFEFGGLTFIEYPGVRPDGTQFVPAGECYFLPRGTNDSMVTYHSPAVRFDTVGQIAEEAYAWSYKDQKGTKIEIETESNFLSILKRPSAIVRGFSSN
jgi:hypothetical protein